MAATFIIRQSFISLRYNIHYYYIYQYCYYIHFVMYTINGVETSFPRTPNIFKLIVICSLLVINIHETSERPTNNPSKPWPVH